MTNDPERERERKRRWHVENPDRSREIKRRWDAENPEKRAASARAWRQKNPEKVKENADRWRLENLERYRELNRLSMRRTYARRKAKAQRNKAARERYALNPEPERARLRTFHEQHPERAREYQRRFKERHPERAAEQARRGTQAWRDRNADLVRAKGRAASTQRKIDDPDSFRRFYLANLERERERGRRASQLRSRLKKLGLPPRSVHRVYAEQKRSNAAAADLFFTKRRSVPHRTAIDLERPENRAYLNDAVGGRTPRELLARWDEQTARLQARFDVDERLPEILQQNPARQMARIREEVRMDSTARQLRGAPPLEENSEASRRFIRELIEEHFPDRHAAQLVWERAAQHLQEQRIRAATFPPPGSTRSATAPQRRPAPTQRPDRSPGRDR